MTVTVTVTVTVTMTMTISTPRLYCVVLCLLCSDAFLPIPSLGISRYSLAEIRSDQFNYRHTAMLSIVRRPAKLVLILTLTFRAPLRALISFLSFPFLSFPLLSSLTQAELKISFSVPYRSH